MATLTTVRRAAVALAREVARRAPTIASASWWKVERGTRVFLDYNQNCPDRTVASAWSVRPLIDARVSMPLRWHEVTPRLDPRRFHLKNAVTRMKRLGADPLAPVLETKPDLAAVVERLGALQEAEAASR